MATYKRGSGNYKSSFINVITQKAPHTINSETTMQDTELVFPLRASTRYSGLLILRFSSGVTPKIDFTFTAISGTTLAEFGQQTSAPQNPTAFGTDKGFNTDAATEIIILAFFVTTGTGGGTLQFQFAQNVSDAGATVFKQGSQMVVFEE